MVKLFLVRLGTTPVFGLGGPGCSFSSPRDVCMFAIVKLHYVARIFAEENEG